MVDSSCRAVARISICKGLSKRPPNQRASCESEIATWRLNQVGHWLINWGWEYERTIRSLGSVLVLRDAGPDADRQRRILSGSSGAHRGAVSRRRRGGQFCTSVRGPAYQKVESAGRDREQTWCRDHDWRGNGRACCPR